MIRRSLLAILLVIVCYPLCSADNRAGKTVRSVYNEDTITEEGLNTLPEDYYFQVEAVSQEEGKKDWKEIDFHGFFAITSLIHGEDDESHQPSSQLLDENEFTLWFGKRISRKLFFNSEVEIKKGFQEYEMERFEFDYSVIKKLFILRLGKFKYPFGIERFVESAPSNKLIDRPLPSIKVIPGTYSDIGGMLHGSVLFPNNTKLKYEFAVTNGLEGPDPEDVQQLWDNNSSKALGGRLGYECLPGLEIGGSYSRGKYDKDNHLDIDFLGIDIQFTRGNMEVRGEYITGQVEQEEEDGGDYLRNGYYLQISYRYPLNFNYLRYLEGVLRFDSVDPNRNITDGNEADRLAIGINYSLTEHVVFKFEYEIENEPGEEILGKSFIQAIVKW
ncbi:MAG: hypothetical protein E3K32_06985 [wastewater metagenome]|nr:hypothetical protein [Candidatus Loosdrechtia aerotolerans]